MIVSQRRCEPRRGVVSLVEALIAMTMLAAIMTITALILNVLMKVKLAGQEDFETAASTHQLALDWRADVHAATRAAIEPEGVLRLESPDGPTVVYEFVKNGVTRRVEDASETTRFQRYRWPRGASGAWSRTRDKDGETLLTLARNIPPKGSRSTRALRLEAVLGWDRRFQDLEE